MPYRSLTVFLACFLAVGVGCAPEASDPAPPAIADPDTPQRVSLAEVTPMPKSYDGAKLILHGYLASFGAGLILVENKSSPHYSGPRVAVVDLSLRKKAARDENIAHEAHYLESLGCSETYVELLGEVGYLPPEEAYGILHILRIHTFENENFEGEGELCYVKEE